MRTWIYHRDEAAKIVDTDEVDMQELHDAGWRDSPARFEEEDSVVVVTEEPKIVHKQVRRKHDSTTVH